MGSPLTRRPAALALAGVLGVAALAGCGSSGDSPKAKASATVTPYAAVPSGVTLTRPGSDLRLGEHGVVAWHPRQDTVASLDVQVLRLERTTFDKSFQGWQINAKTAATTPYFARMKVTNVSDIDLGKEAVPLFALGSSGQLVAAQAFGQRVFAPCHPSVLPATFPPGSSTELCMVYLISPGQDLKSIAFEPPPAADGTQLAAVTWSGPISNKVLPPKAPKPTKESKKGKKGKRAAAKRSPSPKRTGS